VKPIIGIREELLGSSVDLRLFVDDELIAVNFKDLTDTEIGSVWLSVSWF